MYSFTNSFTFLFIWAVICLLAILRKQTTKKIINTMTDITPKMIQDVICDYLSVSPLHDCVVGVILAQIASKT